MTRKRRTRLHPVNKRRANYAEEAVACYARERGFTGNLEPELADYIGDFLCDLRHLCENRNLDFAALSERGAANHQHECANPNE